MFNVSDTHVLFRDLGLMPGDRLQPTPQKLRLLLWIDLPRRLPPRLPQSVPPWSALSGA